MRLGLALASLAHPNSNPNPHPKQDHRSRLQRHMAVRGFQIKDVPGDNNCQFHALADQLEQVAGHRRVGAIGGWVGGAGGWDRRV